MPRRETTTKEAVTAAPNFEAQLASLERIVRELERGELPLERSLELFEEGVKLSRECQERLNEAERRIEVLLRGPDGSPLVAPFGDGEFDAEEAGGGGDDESVF